MPDTSTITLLAFDNMEALDFAGPYEVFTTAARVAAGLTTNSQKVTPRFQVATVSLDGAVVTARAGLRVLPDGALDRVKHTDVLVIPGGVVNAVMACPITRGWIKGLHAITIITASVCTGAFVLAAAGVITDHEVTTHWEDLDDLQQQFPSLFVTRDVRWVDQRRIVTSAGISAGMDMSLHLVARLAGPELAERTARQMDYRWER